MTVGLTIAKVNTDCVCVSFKVMSWLYQAVPWGRGSIRAGIAMLRLVVQH